MARACRELGAQNEHLGLAAVLAGFNELELVAPKHGVLSTGELRLHYVDWGRVPGTPLVFLHGGCLTARTWDLVCLALRDDHWCVAFDQRGHGDSDWSPEIDYGPDAHVRDLEALVANLGVDRPVLVGQSMGGLNALSYAIRHSAELAGLVLVDVGLQVSRGGAARIAEFVLSTAQPASIDELVEKAVEFNPRRDPRVLRGSLRHNLRQLSDGSWTWKYDHRPLSTAAVERIRRFLPTLRDQVGSIECPTLVLRGAESDVLDDVGASEIADLLPHGRWARVDAAGHNVQGDNPRGLVTELRAFLADAAH